MLAISPSLAIVLANVSALAAATPGSLGAQLHAISGRRIFFGHQSVGKNVIDGVQDLAAQAGVPLRISEGSSLDAPGIVHAFVGENTKPLSKIEAFEKAIDAGAAGQAEIAFFKFCYVDFDASTDARALFDRYQRALSGLRKRHPRIGWVHVTVPLTTTQRGLKGTLKDLLGKPRWGELENIRREEFNALLRDTYRGKEPIFDLAAVESTREDGSIQRFERDGRSHPSLVPEYSDDGEHLNARGRARAAASLVGLLASLAPARP